MKYTEEAKNAILKSLELGHTRYDACTLADISPDTFYRWLKEPDKADFLEAVKKAELKLKNYCMAIIAKGLPNDPRLALEVMGRRFPKEWSAHTRQQLSLEDSDEEIELAKRKERVTKRFKEILSIPESKSQNGKNGAHSNGNGNGEIVLE